MNLGTKIALVISGSVLLFLLGVSGAIYVVQKATIERTLQAGLENAARITRQHLEDYLVERYRDLNAVAGSSRLAGDPVSAAVELRSVLAAFPEFHSLILIAGTTGVLAHAGEPLLPGSGVTLAQAAASWLEDAKAGARVIDRVTEAPGKTSRYLVFVAPLQRAAIDDDGWIFAQVNHKKLVAISNAVRIGATGRATLFNHHGRVIGHPDQRHFGHAVALHDPAGLNFAGPDRTTSGGNDRDRWGVTLMLKDAHESLGLHWSIRVDQARAELYTPISQVRHMFVAGVVAGGLGIALLSLWFARRLTGPLAAIQHGMTGFFRFLNREIDTPPPLRVHTRDEIGQMARTINAGIEVAAAGIARERQLERVQHETLERLQNIASRVPGVVLEFRLGPDGRTSLPYASDAIREVYGVTPEEVRDDASAAWAAIHPEDIEGVVEAIRVSARDLTPFQNEHRVKFADGSVRHLFARSSPQRQGDGSVLWHGFVSDITERKRTAEALRRSEERYRRIVETSLDGFWILDRHARFVEVNAAYCRMTGYTREELLGMSIAEMEEDRSPQQLDRYLRGVVANSPARFESRHRHKHGKLVDIDVSTVHESGDPDQHFIAFVRDISLRKRQETALRLIAEKLAVDSGENFFKEMTSGLLTLLGADYVLVGELRDTDSRIATLAVATPVGFIDNLSYALPGTPCSNVTGATFCVYPRGVAQLFPLDTMLGEMGAQAYAGVSLADSAERIVGIIAVLWKRPLAADEQPEAILRIFAARAGAELERFRAEEALRVTRISVERTSDALYWLTPDGRIVDVNEAACRALGYSRAELLHLSILDVDPVYTAEQYEATIAKLRQRGSLTFESVHRAKDGRVFPVEIVANYVALDDRELNCAFARDITERKRTEARMREALVVFNASTQAIMTTDAAGTITAVNPAFCAITHYAREEVIGRNPSMFQSGHHDEAFYAELWGTLTRTGTWEGEIWNRRKNGEIYPEWLTIAAVRDDAGKVVEYVALFSDITDRKEREQMVWHQANFDALTGLANRNLLHDRLERALSRARRSGKKAGLLYVDLDGFKWINDTLGHHIGDELLIEVGRRLLSCVRDQDTVARPGGDEFTMVVHDVGSIEDLRGIGEKVVQTLRTPFTLVGEPYQVSGSVGITVFPDDGDDVQTLIKNADIAMYKAKHAGKNRLQFYAPRMQVGAPLLLHLEADLRTAIAQQAFVLHYQPIVTAGSGELVGAEALIRWQHPQKGLVLPMQFIPAAEDLGLIVDIGEWVLREAARQWQEWRGRGHSPPHLSVNVSAVQFREPGLPELVAQMLAEYGISRGTLALEITESVLMHSGAAADARLRAIKALGVGYSVDDFGTGFSALSYLQRLPTDIVKIDRSFITDCTTDHATIRLLESIIRMAHELGLAVTAEGVETWEQLRIVRDLGIDYLQGFLVSAPVCAAEFEVLIQRHQLLPPDIDHHP